MTGRFVDTNVLLYAISREDVEQAKADVAREILEGPDLVLSTQVLAEFYVEATRASRVDALRHDQAVRLVRSFTRFVVQQVDEEVVLSAMAARDRYRVSYSDAQIIEAARAAGAAEVLSEAFQDGMDFGGVVVTDPFSTSARIPRSVP